MSDAPQPGSDGEDAPLAVLVCAPRRNQWS